MKQESVTISPETNFSTEPPPIPTTLSPAISRKPLLLRHSWSDKFIRSAQDRHILLAMGTAAAVSALVVGVIEYPRHRTTVTATGSSAVSAGFASKMMKLPNRRAAVAAGLAALGTGALCAWFEP